MSPRAKDAAPPANLWEHLAALSRRRWWILSIAALATAAAIAPSLRQEPVFVSEAQVLVRPIALGSSGTPGRINMATEQHLAGSDAVAALTAMPSGEIVVEIVSDTEILSFEFSSTDPAMAQRGAQGFAEAYVTFREQQARAEAAAAAQTLRRQITLEREQLRMVAERLATVTDATRRAGLEAQQVLLATAISGVRSDLNVLEATSRMQVGQIVAPAFLPEEPEGPKPVRAGAVGLAAGVLLGVAVALVGGRLDDRVHGPQALEAATGTATLSAIGHIPAGLRKEGLVMLAQHDNRFAESFRTLRTALLFAASGRNARTILVTSPNVGEGKTHTVANLAVAIAQSGARVVAVAADLRRPRLHHEFGVPVGPGLTEFLADDRPAQALLVRPEGTQNLWILPCGSREARPPDLLSSRAIGNLLPRLRDVADYVLIDAGPVLAVPDALVLAPHADAVLVVFAAGRTTGREARLAVRRLHVVGGRVIGTVLNMFQPRASESASYDADRDAIEHDRELLRRSKEAAP